MEEAAGQGTDSDGVAGTPCEPGKIHRPDVYIGLWAGLWELAVGLAVAGDRARYGVSREEALRRLGETWEDEIRRDDAAVLRVAKALRDG